MTKPLLDSCNQVRKKYCDAQRSRALSEAKKEQSDVKKKLIKEIDHVNTETQLTTSMIDKLKGNADNMVFQAEKRISLGNPMRNNYKF